MFHVGQKVVCVDVSGVEGEIRKGAIYTICGVTNIDPCGVRDDQIVAPYVHLDEIARGPCPMCGSRVPFTAMRFRPITERKTDISELKKLCEPMPAKNVEVVR